MTISRQQKYMKRPGYAYFSISIPIKLHEALKRKATVEGRSVTSVLRRMLERQLDVADVSNEG